MRKDSIQLYVEQELFKRRETGIPHISYTDEKERHQIIKDGRIDLMEQQFSSKPNGTTGILAKNELRHWKNLLIVSAASFSRSAMDGGLDEETAFAMCDIYIRKAEEINSYQEGFELYKKAYFDFTTAVYMQNKKQYSVYVNKTFHYIQIHLHEQITLDQLAEHTGISRSHLSRIFKEETGLLIRDYIQKTRIDSAKHLLARTDMTLSSISEYLHFSSQSYFIVTFKKYCGITPGDYRKRQRDGPSV